jgi:transposase InsO family protein
MAPPNLPASITYSDFKKLNEPHLATLSHLPNIKVDNASPNANYCYVTFGIEQPTSHCNSLRNDGITETPINGQTSLPPPIPEDILKQCQALQFDSHPSSSVLHSALIDTMLSPQAFSKMQKDDEKYTPIFEAIRKSRTNLYNDFFLKSGVLMKSINTPTNFRIQVIMVPRRLVPTLLEYYHTTYATSHCGPRKMVHVLKRRYLWPNMTQDAKTFIAKCPICLYQKPNRTKPVTYASTPTYSYPNEAVHIDICGPFKCSPEGYKYLLTIIDDFSRFAQAIPIRSKNSHIVAKAFFGHWVQFMGPPKRLHSDAARDLDSQLIQDLCSMLQIKKSRTPAYSPYSNGIIERFHSTMSQFIRSNMSGSDPKSWPSVIPFVIMTYNSLPSSIHKYTPNEIIFGNNELTHHLIPVIPIDHPMFSHSDYLKSLRETQDSTWQIIRKSLQQEKDKRQPAITTEQPYIIGDFLLVKKFYFTGGPGAKKASDYYEGPYLVIKIFPQAIMVVHWSTPWQDDNTPVLQFLNQKKPTKIATRLVHPRNCKNTPLLLNRQRDGILN